MGAWYILSRIITKNSESTTFKTIKNPKKGKKERKMNIEQIG